MFRWNGLQQGNVRNYFLYAIGEILLVVIGILIALSINNWNKEKELRKSEKQIYKNILRKISEDKSDIEGNIIYNNERMIQFRYANEIIGSQNIEQIDTLKVILLKLFDYSDFDSSNNIYQNLVNSGELKLLKNDRIINQLQELEEHYIYTNRMESIHMEVILRFVGPGLMDNIHFSDMKVEEANELYSFQIQNLLFSVMDIMAEKDDVYQSTINQIDTISESINEELNQ